MKTGKILILLLIFVSCAQADFIDYFNLKIGNIYVYDCVVQYSSSSGSCSGHHKIKVVITDTVNYYGKTYYTYTKQNITIYGSGNCAFYVYAFPFNMGNAARVDSINGNIYIYNPGNPCTYSPYESMIDSLNCNLFDTIRVGCISPNYTYVCVDTTNYRDYLWNQGIFELFRRQYERFVGLVNTHRTTWGSTWGKNIDVTLVGRVINGIVYGDTSFTIVGNLNNKNEIPAVFSLSQNYPNPFNPITKIKFQIPLSRGVSAGRGVLVRLIIYDALGREVATILYERLSPSTYEVEWDASNYPSGVYFYKLIVSDASAPLSIKYSETKKMVLMK